MTIENPMGQGGPATQATPVRGGPVVVGSLQAPQADFAGAARNAETSFATLEALGNLAGAIVKPAIERAKKEAYVDGMLRAQQGESASSIQDGMLFGRLFGDGWTAAAARGYESMTAVTDTVNGIMSDMDSLAEMTPTEFRRAISTRMQESMIGDPETDQVVMQKFAEMTPQITQAHTRARVQYEDKTAIQAWHNSALAGAKNLSVARKQFEAGNLSEDLLTSTKEHAVIGMSPPPGMRPSAVAAGYGQMASSLLNDGDFEAYDLLVDSGLYDTLVGPDVAQALQNQRTQAVAKFMATNPRSREVMGQLTDIKFSASIGAYDTEADLRNALGDLRVEAGQQVGLPYNEYMTQSMEEQLVLQWRNAKMQQEAMKLRQAQGIANEQEDQTTIYRAMYQPEMFAAGNMVYMKDDQYAIHNRTFWNTRSPEEQEQYITSGALAKAALGSNGKLKIPQIEYLLNNGVAAISNGQANNMTEPALMTAAKIVSGPSGVEALTAYVGADNSARIIEMLESGYQPGGDPRRNLEVLQAVSTRTRLKPTEADTEAAAATVKDLSPGVWGRIFGGQKLLTGAAQETVAQEMVPMVAQLRAAYPGADSEQLVQMAATEARRKFDFLGGVPIRKDARKGTIGMEESLQSIPGWNTSVHSAYTQQAVNEVIGSKYPEGYTVIGGHNLGGVGRDHRAVITIMGTTGARHVVQVTAGEIYDKSIALSVSRAEATRRANERRAAQQKQGPTQRFGKPN